MPSDQDLLNTLQQKQLQIQQIAAIVNSKENSIKLRESQLRQRQLNLTPAGMGRGFGDGSPANGNVVTATDTSATTSASSTTPPSDLLANLKRAVGGVLTPGNIGDINSVIWPFYFPTDIPDSPIANNETFQTGFSVTMEAAFIFMSYVKTVYLVSDPGGPGESWTYLDPDQNNPSAPGLFFTMRDGSSSRQFFNTPMAIDSFGNPRFPSKFPRPLMLLPNQVMQIQFINNHPTNVYVPIITAFGYRLRIDEAQKLLSLVYA